MSEPHIIRLRGPWQLTLTDGQGQCRLEKRIHVRNAQDWGRGLEPGELQGLTGSGQPTNESALLSFSRTFQWPGPTLAPRIDLLITGQPPTLIAINDQPVPCRTQPDGHRVTINEFLQPHNHLTIHFSLPAADEGISNLLWGVVLEVQDRDTAAE